MTLTFDTATATPAIQAALLQKVLKADTTSTTTARIIAAENSAREAAAIIPAVGMPATYNIGADRYPYVITRTTPSTFTMVSAEQAEDGTWVAKAGAKEEKATKRQNGRYRLKGENFGGITLGQARLSLDPSF
jgi:hypothetical protein